MAERKIKRALISVYDKTGIVEFARALVEEFGIEILSTGGTAKLLAESDIPVTLVEDITGWGEMLDGRVKTLHPKIHAAILADRDNPQHMQQLAKAGIEPIDMVVVNLYPFEETVSDPDCKFEDAIEMIDIGGPCLLRAAAKNHKHVWAVRSIGEAERILACLRGDSDESDTELRMLLAFKVFALTMLYDNSVRDYLTWKAFSVDDQPFDRFSGPEIPRILHKHTQARYGENPHQRAAFLSDEEFNHLAFPFLDASPAFSACNFMDASAAFELCSEIDRESPECANPKEPRASARAEFEDGNPFQPPDPNTRAWLLTWTTYGSWLPGDERGFVSRVPSETGKHEIHNQPGEPYDHDQPELTDTARSAMAGKSVRLTKEQARTALQSFVRSARDQGIRLIAASVMCDHVHLLCQAEESGAHLLQLFKGGASRRLNDSFKLEHAPRWWTKSGSKRHIRRGEDLTAAIRYVRDQRGALAVGIFDGGEEGDSLRVERCDLRTSARAEARGSLGFGKACVFIKHTNACGVGFANDPVEAYRRAYLGDPNAAMGGILACSFDVDARFAEAVMSSLDRWGRDAGAGAFFVEVWLAPRFEQDSRQIILEAKKWGKRVRLLEVGDLPTIQDSNVLETRSVAGGVLMQTPDTIGLNEDEWKVVTRRQPTAEELNDLRLAWLVCKHTKSNAISICRNGMLIGNGAGQMSRVMSCRIATWLAKENGHAEKLTGSVAASDAFFPFRDGPDILIDAGVRAIIQPGGSKRDAETIAACDERDVAMIFTGTRHFKH
jgi:AICAR transformylase/IMP cyclohydrolase PurH/REP element-mobilizing transposase RayT